MKATKLQNQPGADDANDDDRGREDDDPPRLSLNLRQWLLSLVVVLAVVLITPPAWKHIERFSTPPDYRIPYALSKDYWLYGRRLDRLQADQIPVVGDSVVWGEYVSPDGTLSHFLNEQSGQAGRYVNVGVNGLFPIALEGLVRHYGGAIHDQKVVLHCNLLWMSSPEADLSTRKEQKFNHVGLVPQFLSKVPCYRASANDRMSIVLTREVPFLSWAGHLQQAYFDQKSLYAWTLADDGQYPPSYPNATANPLKQITLEVPGEPESDSDRGVNGARHKPWSESGIGTQNFQWVPPEESLQWRAFKRLTNLLRGRGNDVFVIIGPFNTHIMAPENLPRFNAELDAVRKWFDEQDIASFSPPALESALYGDASHPLTEGYQKLAGLILENEKFQAWSGD